MPTLAVASVAGGPGRAVIIRPRVTGAYEQKDMLRLELKPGESVVLVVGRRFILPNLGRDWKMDLYWEESCALCGCAPRYRVLIFFTFPWLFIVIKTVIGPTRGQAACLVLGSDMTVENRARCKKIFDDGPLDVVHVVDDHNRRPVAVGKKLIDRDPLTYLTYPDTPPIVPTTSSDEVPTLDDHLSTSVISQSKELSSGSKISLEMRVDLFDNPLIFFLSFSLGRQIQAVPKTTMIVSAGFRYVNQELKTPFFVIRSTV